MGTPFSYRQSRKKVAVPIVGCVSREKGGCPELPQNRADTTNPAPPGQRSGATTTRRGSGDR
jgi:hypothetical protein